MTECARENDRVADDIKAVLTRAEPCTLDANDSLDVAWLMDAMGTIQLYWFRRSLEITDRKHGDN